MQSGSGSEGVNKNAKTSDEVLTIQDDAIIYIIYMRPKCCEFQT